MFNRKFRELKKNPSRTIGLAYVKVHYSKNQLRKRLTSRPVLRRIYGKIKFMVLIVLKITKKILRVFKRKTRSVQGYLYFMRAFFCKRSANCFEFDINSSSLLLIFPSDYNPHSPNFNGGVKDIQSFHEQIDGLKLRSEYICVSRLTGHALYVLLNRGNRQRIFSASKIIISIPGNSGGILLFLRFLGLPNVIFRSHNAELLHRLDWLRSSKSIKTSFKAFKKMTLGYASDLSVSFFAEGILSVSQMEIEMYWKKFFPWTSRKIYYFPGMSPSHIASSIPIEDTALSNRSFATIVGGFQRETIISQPDKQFLESGSLIKDYVHSLGLSLVSVGEGVEYNFCDTNFGFSYNYEEILKNTSLIIVPSSTGWGFKTKIADAVTLHQSVIIHRTQYDRLGDWQQMVSPINDWREIPNLVLKKISFQEYEEFMENLKGRREECLKSLAK